MDQHKLRTLVFEKTGVKIDIDDPVFALVALNEAVLEDAVQRHVALMDSTSRELVRHARAAGGLAADTPSPSRTAAVLDATNEAAEHEQHQPANPAQPAQPANQPATPAVAVPTDTRQLALVAGGAVLSAVLVLLGQAMLFKPQPIPAPIVQQAKQLTAAQLMALERADKLEKAILKLDPKTRAQLQADLGK